ncbi:MAG TPA: hypothetical protein VFP56_02985 [Candidatus Limnocylindrales bacterium]|nr:hypothetical protein [Candidatus Limnocylindrales bacterium]
MTLPFRHRHHDQEASHDRARALISAELLQPLGGDDATWLARHVDACAECRRDREGFKADQALLRTLRDTTPQPPRDLWARTAAAIDREAGSRRGPAGASARQGRRGFARGLPVGAAAGVLVLLVALGLSYRQAIPPLVPPASGDVAVVSASPAQPPPQPTPLAVAAGDVGWVRPAANGRWELLISRVDEVCPRTRQGCESLGENTPSRTVDLGRDPSGMTLSPSQDQLVVHSVGNDPEADRVYVVPLETSGPVGTDTPPSEPPATQVAPPTEPPSTPAASPVVTPSETPGSTPSGAIEIASGVTMIGEAAYSSDGRWLAFSARPADGSTGPDLYLWHVGDAAATPVTTDHATYFSAWLNDTVLASSVITMAGTPAGVPGASDAPETSPAASPESAAAPLAFHPTSFLLDPDSGARTELTQPDVWLPVVDRGRRVTAYWSGTLVPTADGLDWQLGEGQLVLDRWLEPGSGPSPSEPSAASSDPPTEPAADPSGNPSTAPLEVVGPAGDPVELDVGELGVFKALFGSEGTRLAIWVADDPSAEVGRLHLIVLDPDTGTLDQDIRPLAGEPSLRRFSVDKGRLAWVSPRGQDGQESAVQVLGWKGRNFGEIQTIPAKDLFIVR